MASKKKPAKKRVLPKQKARRPVVKKAAPKAKKINPIPTGMHAITPSLVFKDAEAALKFYRAAFGAKELYRLTEPGGKIGHAEMMIGNSLIMIGEEYPDMKIYSAQHYKGSPVRMHIAVADADKIFKKAIAAGAKVGRPLTNEFYGWRTGVVQDPFGYYWSIGTQIEELTPKQMQKRWDKMMADVPPGYPAQDADGA